MHVKKIFLPITLIFIFLCSLTFAAHPVNHDKLFHKYANHYFDGFYLPANPSVATQMGIHFYDNQIADYSRVSILKEIKQLKAFEKNLKAFDPKTLSPLVRDEYDILLSHVKGQLLNLQTIRAWQNNPDFYSSSISNDAYVIMERNFAPAEVRLKSLIAREKQMPSVLQHARENLKNPPKIFTDIALEQLPGIINFFQNDLPAAFPHVNPDLAKEFNLSNKAVVKALQDYQAWLKSDVLARSKGNFRLGPKVFRRKLLFDEMVDTPLDKLLEIGLQDLHRNQQEFINLAKEVSPKKSTQEVIKELRRTHPAPADLLNTFTASLDNLEKFVREKNIISMPSKGKPIIQETPPFLRAITFASIDPPGPFEQATKEAFYSVTLPNRAWTSDQVEDFMKTYTYPTIINTSIHEVYPGHYVQFLWTNQVHSRIRKLLYANSNVEGWAHYTEQMMFDEGYGTPGYGATDVRDGKFLKLGQLLGALLRDARFIVAIKLHTQNMSIKQAVAFFEKESFQTHMLASLEVKRATSDPTYLYYTLGKLQILKLRKDLQLKEGKTFKLQKFHDDFMRQGFPPIKIVRRAMLQDNSPTL